MTCNRDPEGLAKLFNRRSELSQTLRLQRTARGEPIALHALRGVDDPPETRGLKFSTVMGGFRTPFTSLRCPIVAVPRFTDGSMPKELRRKLGLRS